MANTSRGGRRPSNNGCGCLNSVGGRWRWENFPYYDSCCPDADGIYGDNRRDDRECRRCRDRDRDSCGIFMASLPMAVAANGIVPLVNGMNCGRIFDVNSGMITVKDAGT